MLLDYARGEGSSLSQKLSRLREVEVQLSPQPVIRATTDLHTGSATAFSSLNQAEWR